MRPALFAASALIALCLPASAPAQTVIYPDPPPRADSARPPAASSGTAPATTRDTTRADAGSRDTTRAAPAPYGITPAPAAPAGAAPAPAPPAAPAPSPVVAVDSLVARVCTGAAPGEAAPDVLGIVFRSRTDSAARQAALAAVSGKRLGGTAEDQFQYVLVAAGGSEFRLRALADKLIRLPAVSEVGPVTCPALPAQPVAPAPPSPPGAPAAPAPPAPRDSASS